MTSDKENTEVVKRGRGRPRKAESTESVKEKCKPGRPRKYGSYEEYYQSDIERKRKESVDKSIKNFAMKYATLKQKAIDYGLIEEFMKTLELMFDDYKAIDDTYIVHVSPQK